MRNTLFCTLTFSSSASKTYEDSYIIYPDGNCVSCPNKAFSTPLTVIFRAYIKTFFFIQKFYFSYLMDIVIYSNHAPIFSLIFLRISLSSTNEYVTILARNTYKAAVKNIRKNEGGNCVQTI